MRACLGQSYWSLDGQTTRVNATAPGTIANCAVPSLDGGADKVGHSEKVAPIAAVVRLTAIRKSRELVVSKRDLRWRCL
jgi:hypothetical protein